MGLRVLNVEKVIRVLKNLNWAIFGLWIILSILNSFTWLGRAPPRNTTVDLNSGNIDVPPNMTSWASFHNGVAAGLKIAPASQIDSAWIVYNKPKHAELANEYAGFLMALGLNGHLTKLATLNIHDYLTKVRLPASAVCLIQATAVAPDCSICSSFFILVPLNPFFP